MEKQAPVRNSESQTNVISITAISGVYISIQFRLHVVGSDRTTASKKTFSRLFLNFSTVQQPPTNIFQILVLPEARRNTVLPGSPVSPTLLRPLLLTIRPRANIPLRHHRRRRRRQLWKVEQMELRLRRLSSRLRSRPLPRRSSPENTTRRRASCTSDQFP